MEKVRILALDGGGIRGVITATIMEYVENQLKKITKNPNTRIADHFDMIVGTSTGGILSCIYLTPDENGNVKYSATDALNFYSTLGYKIFNASKRKGMKLRSLWNATKYKHKNIEEIFGEYFEDLKMSDLLKPCIVTTYDLKKRSSFFFNSREDSDKPREFYVRDVVRSTSAAPTYFQPAKILNLALEKENVMINIDGGVFANNPAMCAFAEATKTGFESRLGKGVFPKTNNMLILSIGTGGGQPKLAKSNIFSWGIKGWAESISSIMMDGSIDTVHYQMKNLFDSTSCDCKNYKRIDVPETKPNEYSRNYDLDMAEASAKNIKDLKQAGKDAIAHSQEETKTELGLDDFIKLLEK